MIAHSDIGTVLAPEEAALVSKGDVVEILVPRMADDAPVSRPIMFLSACAAIWSDQERVDELIAEFFGD